jgi:tight adherence protein B
MTDELSRLADGRLLVLASIVALITFVVLLMQRLMRGYERTFVSNIGSTLKYSFIVANPRNLFGISVVTTLCAGLLGYTFLGPAGAVAGLISGVIAPRVIASTLAKRRVKRFVYQLPDALLALASALRAGSNLSKGLELLATRQPKPLSQEFTIVLAEYRIGRSLADALADMRSRIATPEIDLMNTAMNVSRRVGGNLADTLESLAKTLQEKAHIEGKIDALTSMGRAQGWVVGLLPLFIGFVLYQQQPERMSLLFTQWYGWVVLAVVAIMMAIAAWMIRKIVNIDV